VERRQGALFVGNSKLLSKECSKPISPLVLIEIKLTVKVISKTRTWSKLLTSRNRRCFSFQNARTYTYSNSFFFILSFSPLFVSNILTVSALELFSFTLQLLSHRNMTFSNENNTHSINYLTPKCRQSIFVINVL